MKIASKRGFSLSELLVVLLIMTITAIAIGVGISSAAKAYKDIKAGTESSILCGTLATELSDTLRFATDVSAGGGAAVFTHRRYGQNISVNTRDGRVYAGDSPILSDTAYSEFFAEAEATYDGSLFTLIITVFDVDGKAELKTLELAVSPLST